MTDTHRWLARYYALVDAKDVDGSMAFFAPDAGMRMGNHRPLVGRDAIAAAFGATLAGVGSLRHELVNVWEPEPGTVVFELEVTYRMTGRDEPIVVNGSGVCTVRDGLFTEQRLYGDLTGVFGR